MLTLGQLLHHGQGDVTVPQVKVLQVVLLRNFVSDKYVKRLVIDPAIGLRAERCLQFYAFLKR